MLTDLHFYLFAIPAVFLIGLAKGGFSGIGSLGMPIMALGIPPLTAAAVLLPILIIQDAVSVWMFRRTWDGAVLKAMLPGMVIGVGGGYLFAARVSPDAVMGAVGLISAVFAIQRLWLERGKQIVMAAHSPAWMGSVFGAISGFTSQIAHAGAPPFQMWVLPRRLPRDSFVGTSAIFFAIMNWVKVPAYAALGQFTLPNMLAAAALIPVALLSTYAGARLVRAVSPDRFYTIIYVLMLLLGVKLMWDAVV